MCALVSKSTLPKAWIKIFIKSEGHYDSWQCSSIFQCLKFKAKSIISSEKKVGLTWTQIFAVQHLQPVLPKWADVSKVNINIQYKLNLEISFCLTCWHWWLLLLLFLDYGSYARHFSAYKHITALWKLNAQFAFYYFRGSRTGLFSLRGQQRASLKMTNAHTGALWVAQWGRVLIAWLVFSSL